MKADIPRGKVTVMGTPLHQHQSPPSPTFLTNHGPTTALQSQEHQAANRGKAGCLLAEGFSTKSCVITQVPCPGADEEIVTEHITINVRLDGCLWDQVETGTLLGLPVQSDPEPKDDEHKSNWDDHTHIHHDSRATVGPRA
jgi:hypothetical protein